MVSFHAIESKLFSVHNIFPQYTKEVIMIQQQRTVSNEDQPTVAIICVNYYEKLAVDAMMSNKVTFVRHKPEGKKRKCLFFCLIC